MPKHSEPVIQGWKLRPPAGGWRITFHINGEEFAFAGQPKQIVSRLFKIAEANGVMESIEEAWLYCNTVWCDRDPERCTCKDLKPEPGKPRHTERYKRHMQSRSHTAVSPKEFGHKIWGWLATFGMSGAFRKNAWLQTIRRVTELLNPRINPKTGCIECSIEWDLICNTDSPSKVETAEDAAKWVFRAHNRVNKKLGKPIMSWERAVRMHHWDTPL